MRPLMMIDSSICAGARPVETVDADRRAFAARLARARGWSPLRAFLVAVRGWNETVARAYSLLGDDGWTILSRHEAIVAGYERNLLI